MEIRARTPINHVEPALEYNRRNQEDELLSREEPFEGSASLVSRPYVLLVANDEEDAALTIDYSTEG